MEETYEQMLERMEHEALEWAEWELFEREQQRLEEMNKKEKPRG